MTLRNKQSSSAFTLVELLVVIGIIALLASIMIPVISSLTKSNSQKQAVNTITTYLAAARSRAIAEGRQVGIVFFEDTDDLERTAMQICVEENYKINGGVEYTTFSAVDSRITFLPRGVAVATLNDANNAGLADNTTASAKTRAIIFDAQGQLALRNGLCLLPDSATGVFPGTYSDGKIILSGGIAFQSLRNNNFVNSATDLTNTNNWRPVSWHFDADYATPGSQSNGYSSPGVFIFNLPEFRAANLSTDAVRLTWIKDHAEVVIVNANTGAVIR